MSKTQLIKLMQGGASLYTWKEKGRTAIYLAHDGDAIRVPRKFVQALEESGILTASSTGPNDSTTEWHLTK